MARKSKQAKWDKAKAIREKVERKTAASRQQRLHNKHKREAIQEQMGDVKITMIGGVAYTDDGDTIQLVNGIYKLVPSAIPEDVHTATEILESYEDCHRNTCEHGNALASNCSDCDEELTQVDIIMEYDRTGAIPPEETARLLNIAQDEHEAAEELAKYDDEVLGMSVTAEEPRKVILRNDPATKSRFELLKDKLRGNR